jgi:hypothetical protein
LLFEKFLDKLKSQKNTADWQIRQARDNDLHPCGERYGECSPKSP